METAVVKTECDVCGNDTDPNKVWHPVFVRSRHGKGRDRANAKYEEGVACCLRCAWQFSQYGKEETEKKTSATPEENKNELRTI